MKTIKRALSLFLALLLTLALTVPALAGEAETQASCAHTITYEAHTTEWEPYNDTEHKIVKVTYKVCSACGYRVKISSESRGYAKHSFGANQYGAVHSGDYTTHYGYYRQMCSACHYSKIVSRFPTGCTAAGCVDLMSQTPVIM